MQDSPAYFRHRMMRASKHSKATLSLMRIKVGHASLSARVVWAQTDAYIQELQSDKQRREDEERKVKEQRQQEVEAHAKVPQGPTLPNLGVQNRLK